MEERKDHFNHCDCWLAGRVNRQGNAIKISMRLFFVALVLSVLAGLLGAFIGKIFG